MIPRCLAVAALSLSISVAVHGDPAVTTASTNTPPDAVAALQRLRVAPGLKLSLWASEPLVQNIVSVAYDGGGRAYVVETGRRRTSVFDIRNFTKWLDEDFALRSVEDRAALLRRWLNPTNSDYAEFAQIAGKGGKPGGLEDFNHDGVLDSHDLEVESERIRLVSDSTGTGRADTSVVFADDFRGITSGVAAGVLPQGTNVWFTCIPDLWRFPAAKPQDVLPAKGERLLHGFGVHVAFGGHDLHGLIKGFDGRIYFSIADRGTSITNREGHVFSLPDCGAVFRCEPDGSDFEVVARGLRNPQELAFDDFGNLWTGDNNGDGGDKARWTLVLKGADYGWSMGWQWQPKMGAWNSERLWHTRESNTAAYIMPPVAHIGHGPAGIAYYPGTGLGERYIGHFFYADFPGGVRTFRVEPDGAFFKIVPPEGKPGALEDNSTANFAGKLLWDLSPVDVTFPPFGGVIVADWVQGWDKTGKGRLWHITDPSLAGDPQIATIKRLLAEGTTGRNAPELISLLGNPDQRVRLEAQWELAARGPANWNALLDTAWANTNRLARIHALQGLAQIVRAQPLSGFGDESKALLAFGRDNDPEVRVQAAKALAESRLREARPMLASMLADAEPRIRGAAAMALADLIEAPTPRMGIPQKSTDASPAGQKAAQILATLGDLGNGGEDELVTMAIQNGGRDPVLNHALTSLLKAQVQHGYSEAFKVLSRANQPPEIRLAALLAQRRMGDAGIARWLRDSDPRLVLEAARAINDLPIPAARNALAALIQINNMPQAPAAWPAGLPFTRDEWTYFVLRRAVNAAYRAGDGKVPGRLAELAVMTNLPVALRVEALDDLADWAHPPRRDKVVGVHRPLMPRPAEPALMALTSVWQQLTRPDSPAVLLIAALHAGAALKLPETLSTAQSLAQHPEANVRAEAAKILDASQTTTPAQLIADLDTGTLAAKRSALTKLAGTTDTTAIAALQESFATLRTRKAPPELELDIQEAAIKTPALAAQVRDWTNSWSQGDNLAPYRTTLLGGNALTGKKLFAERAEWGCQRCHKLEGEGGDVGPELSGIGRKRGREYVLRSIVDPNAEIAPGFDNQLIELKDGSNLSGVLKGETATTLDIQTAEGKRVSLTKVDIASRTRGLSPMPEGLIDIMSKRELRDLIEALSQ
ncbi:MAG TPA: HEAT repeat domain-containing protein [Candidatus Limnocylindria bacterium]|jgi:quinoprotein glucose dehydrogenase|nr:HEAT repeat domain-containing protein [Candidatus Limnocylindria bacterium]